MGMSLSGCPSVLALAFELRRISRRPAFAPIRHGRAPIRERAMPILRVVLVGLFLLTLPTGMPLLNGAVAFTLVLLAGIAVESLA